MMFTIKHLQDRLKSEGLPYSYNTIVRYEKTGIIKKSVVGPEYKGGITRTYTAQEIDYIVEAIKNRNRKV